MRKAFLQSSSSVSSISFSFQSWLPAKYVDQIRSEGITEHETKNRQEGLQGMRPNPVQNETKPIQEGVMGDENKF